MLAHGIRVPYHAEGQLAATQLYSKPNTPISWSTHRTDTEKTTTVLEGRYALGGTKTYLPAVTVSVMLFLE